MADNYYSDLHDLTMTLHRETDKAVLVSDDGDIRRAVWVAKSQIEIERKRGAIVVVTAPEWLATEKGLL